MNSFLDDLKKYRIVIAIALFAILMIALLLIFTSKNQYSSPVITLIGNEITIKKGYSYIEPGFTATDKIDGNITSKVVTETNLNPNIIGTYTIIYRVTNTHNKTVIVTRTVNVIKNDYNLEIKVTHQKLNNKINIKLEIIGEGYKETIDPIGNKYSDRIISYAVSNNGNYKFYIYDLNDEYILKVVPVIGIDNVAPTGSCTSTVDGTKIKIVVSAHDNEGIAGYNYIINGKETGYKTTPIHEITGSTAKIQVVIKDTSSNNITVNCNAYKNLASGINQYKYNGINYLLYVPNNATTLSNLPLIVFFLGSSGSASSMETMKNNISKYVNETTKTQAIYLFPNVYPATYEDKYSQLRTLIDYVVTENNVNKNKIAFTGHSRGAMFGYRFIGKNPGLFSCFVPISGTWDSRTSATAAELINIPVRAYHSEGDMNVKYSYDKSSINYMKSIGVDATFITIPGNVHNITSLIYNDPEIMNWMIIQNRKG